MDKNLWAAISVSHPVVDREDFVIHLAIVNDGNRTIDPELKSSQLLVNGKMIGEDWLITIGSGPRDARFTALPPGDYLHIAFALRRDSQDALAKHFREPGIYRVSWKGKDFQSPEIIFRIMPRRGK